MTASEQQREAMEQQPIGIRYRIAGGALYGAHWKYEDDPESVRRIKAAVVEDEDEPTRGQPFYETEPLYAAPAALPPAVSLLLRQAAEALELGRDYIAAELAHRQEAYAGYPHKYATEQDDLARIESVAAALRQRMGRE
jgi:hypothetical protein